LTCGSRGAFLFLPFIFITVAALRIGMRGTPSLASALIILIALGAGALYFDSSALFDHMAELSESYGSGLVVGGLGYAMEAAGIWGFGVGTGTIATRYLLDPSQLNSFFSGTIENFYAKAWIEMGAFGFVVITLTLASIIVAGLRTLPRIRDPKLRDCGIAVAAMTIFVAFISTRGWALDQDPFAYYYYLFAGFLFKLPYISAQSAAAPVRRAVLNQVGRVAVPGMRINLR
jgi:O-antigen ligase